VNMEDDDEDAEISAEGFSMGRVTNNSNCLDVDTGGNDCDIDGNDKNESKDNAEGESEPKREGIVDAVGEAGRHDVEQDGEGRGFADAAGDHVVEQDAEGGGFADAAGEGGDHGVEQDAKESEPKDINEDARRVDSGIADDVLALSSECAQVPDDKSSALGQTVMRQSSSRPH
jgi:hypothetical protein